MLKKPCLTINLLLVIGLLLVGCGNPEAIKPLTNDEKSAMIGIALDHSEVSRWLETADLYNAEVGWAAIGWNDSEATGWARLEYEEIADGDLPSDRAFPSKSTSINPDVYISVGEPASMFISVAFSRETKEVVAVQVMPGRPTRGPAPPE